MNPREEQERALRSYPQGELKSPFLEEELFVGETEADWEVHLTALEAESPFRHTFEQSSAIPLEPEEPEEEFIEEEEEGTEADDSLLAEAEDYNGGALADLEENIEEFDDEDEEIRYAEREEEFYPENATLLTEEAHLSEEIWNEPEEEATYAGEDLAVEEGFFIEHEGDANWEISESEQWSEHEGQDPRAWILALDRSAIERVPDSEQRQRFLEGIDWSRVEFPKNGPNTSAVRANWQLADELFKAMAVVTSERRVPHLIKYRNVDREVVEVPGQKNRKLFPEARDAFVSMRNAAESDGVRLVITSAWRSRKKQKELRRKQSNPNAVAKGNSAHMYGLAVDLRMSVDGLEVKEANTRTPEKMANLVRMYRSPVYKWMALRGREFGWYPYRREPWHWEYNPPELKDRFEGTTAVSKPAVSGGADPAQPTSPGSVDLLPTWLSERVKSGLLTLQAGWAMLTGQRDVNTLTNMIFYARHPDLPVGYKIKPHEKQLAGKWVRIRDDVVKPLLRRLAAGVPTGSTSPTVPAPSPTSTITPPQPSPRVITAVEQYQSLERILDRIRAAPKTYIKPRTRRVVVDGYERTEPRGDLWCHQAGLTLDEGALARMVASEVGTKPPQYMVAVIEATMNQARTKKISAFQQITMQGLTLKGGVTPKSAGYFGRQSGRWCASIQDPTLQHLEVVRVALSAPEPLVTRDGRRWVDGKVMDGGRQAGKRLKNNAVTIVEKWGAEGWEWIGPVYAPDGQTPLLDPYRLMVLRYAGRGKADIRRGVEAMREGRRRWNISVD